MINKIILGLCLLLSVASFSQESTSSPYSYYGIGESRFIGNAESRSMGGINVIPDSTRINFQNPAGFANIKWTSFSVGASTIETKLKSQNAVATAKRTTFDYLALAIPLGKFGAGFGIVPMSSVGYRISNKEANNIENRFNGSGGINKVFLGTGYRILPNLSVGVIAYYNFGKIETTALSIDNDLSSGSLQTNTNDLNGFSFNVGLMYQHKLTDKTKLFSSVYYTPKNTLNSVNEQVNSIVDANDNFDLIEQDRFDPISDAREMQLAQKWSFGLGIGNAQKWAVGLDFISQDVGKINNVYNTIDGVTFQKNQRFAVGGYFTPSVKPFSNYLKKMTYRAGFVHEITGLVVQGTPIKDTGISLGFGLPVKGSLSNLNLGFQVGKRGTTKNNLVEENYLMINLGLSLNDKWFVKSKYY